MVSANCQDQAREVNYCTLFLYLISGSFESGIDQVNNIEFIKNSYN